MWLILLLPYRVASESWLCKTVFEMMVLQVNILHWPSSPLRKDDFIPSVLSSVKMFLWLFNLQSCVLSFSQSLPSPPGWLGHEGLPRDSPFAPGKFLAEAFSSSLTRGPQ